jgi:molecular chaperone GrpE (heat shock protein)
MQNPVTSSQASLQTDDPYGTSHQKMPECPDAASDLATSFLQLLQTGSQEWRTLVRAIETLVSSIERANEQQQLATAAIHQELKSLGVTVPGLGARMLETDKLQAERTEQLRLKLDVLGRKLEHSSEEFLEREVKRPLFKEFLRIYEALFVISATKSGEAAAAVTPVAESIERFLESRGFIIIHPSAGDEFNPNEHEPLAKRPAVDPKEHKRLADVFHLGLKTSRYVVTPAKVEVFIHKPANANTRSNEQHHI